MCATRDARLVTFGVRDDGCVGLCVVVGFFASVDAAGSDCALLGPGVFAAGVAVDCAAPDCAIPDKPSISNPNRSNKLPGPRLRTGSGEEEPDIIPLYADCSLPGQPGNQWRNGLVAVLGFGSQTLRPLHSCFMGTLQ